MRSLFICSVFLVVAGCTNSTAPAEAVAGTHDKTIDLPLAIDTAFIQKSDTLQPLSWQDVRKLGSNFLDHGSSQDLRSSISEFCKIDSLKQNNGYKNYVDSLDIGMTKESRAFKLGVAWLNEKTSLLLWSIVYSSYEACPVFSGTRIIGSYKNEKGNYIHVSMGDLSSWADPPSSYSSQITSVIDKAGNVELSRVEVSDDLDVPGETITNSRWKVNPGKNILKVTLFDKTVKNMEKVQ